MLYLDYPMFDYLSFGYYENSFLFLFLMLCIGYAIATFIFKSQSKFIPSLLLSSILTIVAYQLSLCSEFAFSMAILILAVSILLAFRHQIFQRSEDSL